jgi:UDP-galactopyranose mutase
MYKKNMKYDYLVVGSGLYGSIFAHEANKLGKKVLIIEKRSHIGGNCYTEPFENYHIHKYGAHIFHTSQKYIWDYVNQFTPFIQHYHRIKSFYDNKFYSMPINLFTFHQIWPDIKNEQDARKKLESEKLNIENPKNLEEHILSMVGPTLYKMFIENYTTKHWGMEPKNLPASIIKRLPIRFDMNDHYYHDHDIYEGIPEYGYTYLFEKLLGDIDLELNVDYFENRSYFDSLAEKIVYSGPIDRFFDYSYGNLQYRSLTFEDKIVDYDYQGTSVINYPELKYDFTRIIQHRHFQKVKSQKDLISLEFSKNYDGTNEPYYPINTVSDQEIYKLYKNEVDKLDNLIIGGRLGNYKYYDMDMSVANALSAVKKEFSG